MKISLSVRLYIAAIISGGSIVIAAAVFSLYKANDIQSIWLDFNQSRSEKNQVLRALREQVGFGGMIHNYKNYILRKKLSDKEKVIFSLGGSKATVSRYKTFPLNKSELNAIIDIENTLDAYETALNTVEKKIKEGLSAKDIDRLVKIDDSYAHAGLEVLEKNIPRNSNNKAQIQSSKSHLITNIRKELGYVGMIHFYKNYILRHDLELKLKAIQNINATLLYLEKYSKLQLNDKESVAIKQLNYYLNLYKNRLSQLEGFIANGLTPREIDKRVKVDDSHILNSLVVLEQQTILQNEVRADYLNDSIDFIVLSAKFIGVVVFIIFLIISAGSYWFVRLYIVNPIVSLINVMRKLSANNFDIKIKGADNDNEIGDMAKSVEDFRDTAKARLEAEQELSEINLELERRVDERTRKLEYNQNLLQAIVETAVDAIIVIDDQGIIKSFNAAAEKMFGYGKEAALESNINILIPQGETHDHQVYLDNYKSNEKTIPLISKERELIAMHKDGKKFPVEIALGELVLDNQKMFTGIVRDISERHFHEEQIRRTQKMDALGKLTGGIAHDYNNMLGIIIGYAGLLSDALSDNSKLSGYANEIYKAGERGAKLTSKLLDFSRYKPSKEKEIVNINSLMTDLKNMLKKTLTARIELDYQFYDALWEVYVDVADFENALLNMSINAMHAMQEQGKLTIRSENCSVDSHLSKLLDITSGDYIKLSIIDTGCGMTKETKTHIFDPFYSTKDDKGTGLGLSQVYGFVQRSNGAIKVYSELDKGTSFTMYLPRVIHDEKNYIHSFEDELTANGLHGTESILVVDDEPALALLAEEILSSYGYKVQTAANGIEALQCLENDSNVSLILSDIVMPEMDGLALAEKVKLKYPGMLIQFASGYNAASPQAKKELGDEEVISKPYSSRALVKKIRKLLDSK